MKPAGSHFVFLMHQELNGSKKEMISFRKRDSSVGRAWSSCAWLRWVGFSQLCLSLLTWEAINTIISCYQPSRTKGVPLCIVNCHQTTFKLNIETFGNVSILLSQESSLLQWQSSHVNRFLIFLRKKKSCNLLSY